MDCKYQNQLEEKLKLMIEARDLVQSKSNRSKNTKPVYEFVLDMCILIMQEALVFNEKTDDNWIDNPYIGLMNKIKDILLEGTSNNMNQLFDSKTISKKIKSIYVLVYTKNTEKLSANFFKSFFDVMKDNMNKFKEEEDKKIIITCGCNLLLDHDLVYLKDDYYLNCLSEMIVD
jgi:hypothetical protein